jgi:hypothetical protein
MMDMRYWVFSRKYLAIALLLVCTFTLNAQLKELDFDQFDTYLHRNTDSIYVVNFWATWCAPCVAELPHFEQLNEKYRDRKVKVLLVNLDFPKHKDSRVIPFIREHGLKSEVIFLNDPNSNVWIDKVSPAWSGAIPYTVIYISTRRAYYEQSFTYEELEKEVLGFLNE